MRKSFLLIGVLALMVATASAGVTYNTLGSSLSCNSVVGCTQDTPMSITVGGITLTYEPVTSATVGPPSYTSLGDLVTSGVGTGVSLSGEYLLIDITDTGLAQSGNLPQGLFTGLLSTNGSSMSVLFSPNNTTTTFGGNLPGVVLSFGNTVDTFQVANPTEAVVPSTSNGGDTTIQGDVTETIVPEPVTFGLLGGGLLGLGLLKRKRFAR